MRKTTLLAVWGITAIAALTACAPTGEASSATPTASAQSPSAPASTPPEDSLLGACGHELAPEAVAAAVGISAPTNPLLTLSHPTGPAALGGLDCQWAFGDQGAADFAVFTATIVPESVDPDAAAQARSDWDCPASDADLTVGNPGCHRSGVSNGWWYLLTAQANESAALQEQWAAAFEDAVQMAMSASGAPPVAAVPPVNCTRLGAAVAAQSAAMADLVFMADPPQDVAPWDRVTPAATVASGASACSGIPAGDDPLNATSSFSFVLYPGGAGVYAACRENAGAEPWEIPALSGAVMLPDAGDGTVTACATDDVSTVVVAAPLLAGEAPGEGWTPERAAAAEEATVAILASVP